LFLFGGGGGGVFKGFSSLVRKFFNGSLLFS